jgi:hypothetical protein
MAGLLLMSFGAMTVSIPLYLGARRIEAEHRRATKQNEKQGVLARCATCGIDAAIFWCTTHRLRFCANCVAQHHDSKSCLYMPLLAALPSAKHSAAK